MHHTHPHHALVPLPQNLLHQPLTIKMPPPDPKIRPSIHMLYPLPRPQALDPETHHWHPERSILIPFPKNRHVVPAIQEIEQDPL